MTEIAIAVGDLLALDVRRVRVVGKPDGQPWRNHRGCIAVRNTDTGRLSYVAEWRLLKAKRALYEMSQVTLPTRGTR